MRYAIEGEDLCIRVSLDAIAANAEACEGVSVKVKDKAALARSIGRELCECEDAGEDYYLNRTLDAALDRVIESADPSLDINDPPSTDWQCPNCNRIQYKSYGYECDECGTECPQDQQT